MKKTLRATAILLVMFALLFAGCERRASVRQTPVKLLRNAERVMVYKKAATYLGRKEFEGQIDLDRKQIEKLYEYLAAQKYTRLPDPPVWLRDESDKIYTEYYFTIVYGDGNNKKSASFTIHHDRYMIFTRGTVQQDYRLENADCTEAINAILDMGGEE